MEKIEASFSNTAKYLLGTTNRNMQQMNDERNSKKPHQQHQQMDSSDDAHQ